LLKILSKFNSPANLPNGIEELKRFITSEVTGSARMNLMLNTLTDFNVHTTVHQMKVEIKMIGVAAEILRIKLVPSLPKVLGTF